MVREPPKHEEHKELLNSYDTTALRAAVEDKRKLLVDYWGSEEIVYDFMVINPARNKEQYEQSTEFLADKFARAFVHGGKFVIGVMGSSVAAAHDNCNYDSYEKQMQRFLAPVLDKANVKFEVRNAGEGGSCGDSMYNQIWCPRNTLGDDIDIAHYVWTYFESGNLEKIHEMFTRWVLLMQRSPAAQFLNVGAGFSSWHQPINDAYAKYGMQYVTVKPTLIKYFDYKFEWKAIGDGKHNVTRYGENEKDEFRKHELGIAYQNWHPGPIGFQVVSDGFSFGYLDAMLRALEKIEEQKKQGTNTLAKTWPKIPPLTLSQDLPAPVACDPSYCLVDDPPGCWNMEYPTYGRSQIYEIAMDNSMNTLKDKYDANAKGWTQWKAGENTKMVPKEHRSGPTHDMCMHLDQCAGYESKGKESGWVVFRLPKAQRGRILICCHGGKDCVEPMIKNTEFQLEHETLKPHAWTVENGKPKLAETKCAVLQEHWSDHFSSENGHIHLGVYAKEPLKISHIMVQ